MRILVALAIVLLSAASPGSVATPATDPAPFEPIASVVTHPRCINCHQDQSPTQTDLKIVHRPLVVRERDGHGAPTPPSQTCHKTPNPAAAPLRGGAAGPRPP